jgi:hypothetical protein
MPDMPGNTARFLWKKTSEVKKTSCSWRLAACAWFCNEMWVLACALLLNRLRVDSFLLRPATLQLRGRGACDDYLISCDTALSNELEGGDGDTDANRRTRLISIGFVLTAMMAAGGSAQAAGQESSTFLVTSKNSTNA